MLLAAAKETPSLNDLVQADLDYICSNLADEFAQLSGKRLLITGGAGFLGYYLVKSALHYNRTISPTNPIQVTVWDSFIRGCPNWLSSLTGNLHLVVESHDLIQPLPPSMPEFDWIIHAAGIASPPYYRRYPLQTIDANINGLRNLLEHCLQRRDVGRPVRGFLFYSSSEIYGDPPPEWIPTPEHFRGYVSCTGPRACYDESKRFGETLCVVFAQQHGIPTKVARPFNNYGPGLKISDKRVIPDLARDILDGRDVTMFSDGSPKRTFCYSADAIIGYYKVLVNGRVGEAYNIGMDRPEISISDLANRLVLTARDLFGYSGKLVIRNNPEAAYLVDNPQRRCPDLEKSRRDLGYNPTISIDEGLRRTLIWYYFNQDGEEG